MKTTARSDYYVVMRGLLGFFGGVREWMRRLQSSGVDWG